MFFITSLIGHCAGTTGPQVADKKLNGAARCYVATIVGDALISITALVVGILGIVGILQGLPPAASYTLIGLSGGITLSWLVMIVVSKGKILPSAMKLLQAAVSSDPEL
ncbi:hypothetical protein ACFLR2_01785 [Chlamydiota bacterium]